MKGELRFCKREEEMKTKTKKQNKSSRRNQPKPTTTTTTDKRSELGEQTDGFCSFEAHKRAVFTQ